MSQLRAVYNCNDSTLVAAQFMIGFDAKTESGKSSLPTQQVQGLLYVSNALYGPLVFDCSITTQDP